MRALSALPLFAFFPQFVGLIHAQAPTFAVSSVVPSDARRAQPLRPGMLVSIYGRYLGPESGCTERPSGNERTAMCGSRVTVGGIQAGLLYVQERQINLRVPNGSPTEGLVKFVVEYNGRSSAPMAVPFAPQELQIKLEGEAYVHMPIWVDVALPDPLRANFRYPMTIWPADFGGHDLEVRRNGAALPRLTVNDGIPKATSCIGAPGMIGACGPIGLPHEPKNPARLPMHLLYRFDKPGTYQVRYQGYDSQLLRQKRVLARSSWLQFEVHDYPADRRIEWLATMRRAAPSDPVELMSDFLPSVLALPDGAALPLVEDYLYDSNALVREYSLYALYSFDDRLVIPRIPDLIRRRGPTPDLAYYLSWRRDLLQPQAADLARAVLPYLDSQTTVVANGALKALEFLKQHYDWHDHPEMPALMDAAVLNSAGSLIARGSPDTPQLLAEYLGGVKTDRSRELLWRLVEQNAAREQALICLTWIADPRDLSKLGGYNTGSLDYSLTRAYGKAAAPYLRGGRR
jgi:hypothetical protein